MKILRIFSVIVFALSLFLSGCQSENVPIIQDSTRPPEPEPVITYDWMAGESPVPSQRSGMCRACVSTNEVAVSPSGMYYLPHVSGTNDSYIVYADHGSNMFIKLCGRADCSHNNSDCNAHLNDGTHLSYYGGYLYAVAGGRMVTERCELIRMNPDGSNRMTTLDLYAFAKNQGGDFATCELITDGICIFAVYRWKGTGGTVTSSKMNYYFYKLDGSMKEPADLESSTGILYSCGDVLLAYRGEVRHGGEYGSYWNWDPDANALTYLTDHPGQPGWFGEEHAYYFKDGAICRLTYETQTEEVLVDTGLEGKYYLFSFPDCMVLASRDDSDSADNNLYIYNWAHELVETVEINYDHTGRTQFVLLSETAERLILTDRFEGKPLYYINKSDFGTGQAEIHKFSYVG